MVILYNRNHVKNPHAINWLEAITLPVEIYKQEYERYWYERYDEEYFGEQVFIWEMVSWLYGEPLR